MTGTACCGERRRRRSGGRRRRRREGWSMALGRRASGPGMCEPRVGCLWQRGVVYLWVCFYDCLTACLVRFFSVGPEESIIVIL